MAPHKELAEGAAANDPFGIGRHAQDRLRATLKYAPPRAFRVGRSTHAHGLLPAVGLHAREEALLLIGAAELGGSRERPCPRIGDVCVRAGTLQPLLASFMPEPAGAGSERQWTQRQRGQHDAEREVGCLEDARGRWDLRSRGHVGLLHG